MHSFFVLLKEIRLLVNLKQYAIVLISIIPIIVFGQDFDLVGSQKINPQEAQELRQLIQQTPPEGLNKQNLNQWFLTRDSAAFRLGDPSERERILRLWLATSPNIDAKWTLGSYLMENSSKPEEGFALMEEVLQEQKHPVHMVRVRSRLAKGYLEEHNLNKAQQLLDQANTIIANDFSRYRTNAIGYWSVRAEMEFYRSQSRLSKRKGHFDSAIDEAKKARAKGAELRQWEQFASDRQKIFGRSWHASSAVEVAVAQISAGRIFEAEESLREARSLFKAYEFTENQMAFFYRWVSDLYFAQARYDDSIRVAKKVRQIQLQDGLPDNTVQSIWTRQRITKNLVAQRRWQDALNEFSEVDRAVGDNARLKAVARMVDLRGLTQLQTNQINESIKTFKSTLDWTSRNFGDKHYFTAFKRGLYGLALARDTAQQDLAFQELTIAVRLLSAPDTLSSNYEETPFRLSLRQDIFKTYIKMLSQRQASTPDAADLAFSASAHLLTSSVQQAISDAAARSAIKKPGLGEIARQDQDSKAELTTLYSFISAQAGESEQQKITPEVIKAMRERINELESQRRQNKAQIQKEYPEYFQLLQPKSPLPKDISDQLKSNEIFISIVPMDDETYVFAVNSTGKSVMYRSQLTQNDIKQLVKNIRSTLDVAELGPKAPRFKFDAAYRLYQSLLAPMENMLDGKDHLIVATSGSLGQIPFGVLVRKPWTTSDYAQAPWLIRDFGVSHVSSASAWLSLKTLSKSPSGKQPLMAWGDPSFTITSASSSSKNSVRSILNKHAIYGDLDKAAVDQVRYATLPPLPETREEVLSLAKLLKADIQTDVFLGEKATRESVLLASENSKLIDKQVIVFATHGLLPGDLPKLEQPALAMSAMAGATTSPLLTLEDVMGLRLNADWVILSACNTAGGDGKVEEAMSGLARGFFYAGGRSLLVTHWSVESESAMRLTTKTLELYKSQPNISRAQALRQSMLHLMQNQTYSHPTYWAPYALVGEGSR